MNGDDQLSQISAPDDSLLGVARSDAAATADDDLLTAARGDDADAAESALAEITRAYAPYIESQARRRTGFRQWYEDAVQEGYLALIEAVRDFDPARGIPFKPFANLRIKQAIRHFAEREWRHHRRVTSFEDMAEDMAGRDEDSGVSADELEILGVLEPGYERVLGLPLREAVAKFITSLTAGQRRVLRRIGLEDLPQTAVAKELRVHPVAVNRTLQRVRVRAERELREVIMDLGVA